MKVKNIQDGSIIEVPDVHGNSLIRGHGFEECKENVSRGKVSKAGDPSGSRAGRPKRNKRRPKSDTSGTK